ncbi:hypothetical protein BASA61_004614 [Batrachochytrium salamandrivorans]|nr:hypothetical protein BASA61_004614 [Batrachochytrium salamandrivorans]
MNFLSALYSTSNARIRSGSLLSDPFPVQRGVRQGCPLSGLLFNVFINDVFDGVAPISIPGLSQEHYSFKKKRAITAAVHSISPLLRNNFLSTSTNTAENTEAYPVQQWVTEHVKSGDDTENCTLEISQENLVTQL